MEPIFLLRGIGGWHRLEIFDHYLFVINLADPGRLATLWMRDALFRHCGDDATGRTEPGDNFLFDFVQSEDEILPGTGWCWSWIREVKLRPGLKLELIHAWGGQLLPEIAPVGT